ncbi:hypothetical protein INR49_019408 [Caranx melampygus]|nr:hypothetical protein INR49_019408 [Caranx melampygus]
MSKMEVFLSTSGNRALLSRSRSPETPPLSFPAHPGLPSSKTSSSAGSSPLRSAGPGTATPHEPPFVYLLFTAVNMAQINACLKRVFTVFNILFAIIGVLIIGFTLLSQVSIGIHEDKYFHHGLLLCYTVGTITMVIAILGAYGAYKERLVPLIIFPSIMEQKLKAFLPLDQASPEDQNEVNFLQSQSLLSKSIYTKPCFPIILHFMQLVLDIALAIVFSLLVLALLGMILSSIIIHQMRYPTNPGRAAAVPPAFTSVPAVFIGAPPKYQELHNPPNC